MSQHSKASSSPATSSNAPNTETTRKFNVLACHGFLQDGETFRNRTGSLRRAVKSLVADFVFIDAPLQVSDADATATLGFEKSGGPSWWSVNRQDTSKDDTTSLDASYDKLRAALDEHEPDGLLGFSQGATMIAFFLSRLQQTAPTRAAKIRFVILVSGFMPSWAGWSNDLIGNLPSHIESLHIIGTQDGIVPPSSSETLAACFETAAGAKKTHVWKHEGGHMVPAVKGGNANVLRTFLDLCLTTEQDQDHHQQQQQDQ